VSEERFRLLSEATFEGIALHADQRILDANQNYARMFGYASEELIGMDVLDLTAPESRELMRKHIRESYEKPYELLGFRKDGSTFPIEVAGKNVPYYGRIVRVSTVSDLTERKRAEEELRQRARQLTAIHETSLDITAPFGLPTVLNKIVERATLLLDCTSGGLYLCDAARREVRCVVSYNTMQNYTGLTLAYGEGAAGIVAETGKPLSIGKDGAWPDRAMVIDDELLFAAVLNVPMLWQGQVIGVLTVNSRDRQFSDNDLTLLSLFADHAAIAVENARLFDEVRRLAEDPEIRGLILPAIDYGVTRYTRRFPGPVHVDEDTLHALIVDVCKSAIGQGFHHLVIVNNHFEPEHVQTLHRAIDTVQQRTGATVGYLDLTRRERASRLTEEFGRGECHAGRYETSLVLADHPELVDLEVMRELPYVPVNRAAVSAEGRKEFVEMGLVDAYCGAPAEASAEEGEQITSLD